MFCPNNQKQICTLKQWKCRRLAPCIPKHSYLKNPTLYCFRISLPSTMYYGPHNGWPNGYMLLREGMANDVRTIVAKVRNSTIERCSTGLATTNGFANLKERTPIIGCPMSSIVTRSVFKGKHNVGFGSCTSLFLSPNILLF